MTVVVDAADQTSSPPSDGRFYMCRNKENAETNSVARGVVSVRTVHDTLVMAGKLSRLERHVVKIAVVDFTNGLTAGQQVFFMKRFIMAVGLAAMRTGNDLHTPHIRRCVGQRDPDGHQFVRIKPEVRGVLVP